MSCSTCVSPQGRRVIIPAVYGCTKHCQNWTDPGIQKRVHAAYKHVHFVNKLKVQLTIIYNYVLDFNQLSTPYLSESSSCCLLGFQYANLSTTDTCTTPEAVPLWISSIDSPLSCAPFTPQCKCI